MIGLLLWGVTTLAAAYELTRHHWWAAALPALVVLVWYANAVCLIALAVRHVRTQRARRLAQFNADRAELIKAATAELARQQHANRGEFPIP